MSAAALAADGEHDLVKMARTELAAASGGTARVQVQQATGTPGMIRFPKGLQTLSGDSAEKRARSFFSQYGRSFGIASPDRDLQLEASIVDRYGMAHVAFSQSYFDVPVFGAMVRTHFNADGTLATVNGTLVPGLTLDPEPTISAGEASDLARIALAKDHSFLPFAFDVDSSRLMVYRTGLARNVPGENHLVWEIEVARLPSVREFFYVDAHSGAIIDRIQGIHSLTRSVRHQTLQNRIWNEGDPLPFSGLSASQNIDVNTLISSAEETYNLFSNITGGSFISYNGNDAAMNAIYEAEFLECPNASWNGLTTNFCAGLAVDDVIAHEWTHAYTGSTHDLIYQWQPGALNEAYSDIFGEVVDLLNTTGLDQPDEPRNADECSAFFGSAGARLEVESPQSVAGSYSVRAGVFSPDPPWSVSGQLEVVNDGTGVTSDGCQEIVGFTAGRIALIDRGECPFTDKAANAEAAGAIGVIVVNNQGDDLVSMGGVPPEGYDTPVIFIGQSDGESLEAAAPDGVTATMDHLIASDNSVRWLVSEDSPNGAIRDMWNPSCFGDPGRVSDSNYWCRDLDNGGVHINSGIPNHAFALLVDGGTSNDSEITPIGMTKAAHIYWRSMSVYQVPTTNFADHADAIELSCADLINQPITDLVTGNVYPETIDAGDCQQVTLALQAVEMRLEPTQCDFEPILDNPAPIVLLPYELFSETFETDPSERWTLSSEGVFEEYTPRNWRWTNFPPEDHEGSVLHAVNSPFVGNCQPGNDQSGVSRAESPAITLPSWTQKAMLIFDHYIATEDGWDGGNLKISVNGGDYQLVTAETFEFNPYNGAIIDTETIDDEEVSNTNPLAGEAGYTGLDQGEISGSWGQSQIDLLAFAGAGDTIRFRFDFGVDGCTGIEGWYLDNVVVKTNAPATAIVRRPSGRMIP